MGAYDYTVFDDDIACDALAEFKDSGSPASDMESYFDSALESEYIEYDEGEFVLAAAAVLDTLLNNTVYPCDDEEFTGWVKTLDPEECQKLLPKAVAAVDAVISESSELYELWGENEELFETWLQDKKGIRDRLAHP